MCGRPIYRNESLISSKGGFPTKFLFMKVYIDSGKIEKIKFILTLLNISRTITPKYGENIPIDFSSIVEPPKKQFKTVQGRFINEFIDTFKLEFRKPQYTIKDFFISLKMGPHGPSVISIVETIKWFNSKQLVYIFTLIGENFFNKYIGPFYTFIKHNNIIIPDGTVSGKIFENIPTNRITGRLSIVDDPECKKRVIAISDYYTQFTLKPIHKVLMNNLSKLPCDRTFTQNPFHKWEGNDPFYSLDLSSATDRFPVHLQQKLINYMLNKSHINELISNYKWSEAWMKLLTDRYYHYSDKEYKYSVGQPMGSYSSWAAFTLAHHLVVQFCAKLNGKFPFTNYIILGDDIVIKDNKVARSYIKFMNKLGVGISLHKTHVSKDTYEFAKRWIRYSPLDGYKEVSPIPLKGIAKNIDNPFTVYTILFDYFLVKMNQNIFKLNIISLVVRLYNNLNFKYYDKGKLVKQVSFSRKYLRSKLYMLDLSMRFSMGLATFDHIRDYMVWSFKDHDWYPIPSFDGTILSNEFKRVLGSSIISTIEQGKTSLMKLQRRFTQYWALSFNEPNKLNLFPLFHAINNWVKETDLFIKSLNEEDLSNFMLLDLYKLINFIDINEILMWDRNYHSRLTCGGRLLSKSRSIVKDSYPNTFLYDVKGYLPEIKSDLGTLEYSIGRFLTYTATIEEGVAKQLHPKQVEMFKQLANRHGYSFLE